ncbi:MAG: dihydroneopterin triphosphate diphosphatase [Neisseria sp.]|jgi:dihydroneopterin triphosphate diphosphatase|nr:dihydroneopterin triphosphate diphosphatase [Neisseria sp.]MBP7258320.1 dihydroneopterin triphosphate diphosphatase [Neisseria sp.]MBP8043367.1 dihydroneopterin triphosphate diphosphatase [Neisseria sp.]MBP8069465.1 dihydroneopterin triphosphate diphosphatase [Neisseria sp.]MBP8875352.1 dihydroneopterin triphosphate diphosphatase [Neisseria sp.]
MSAAKPLKQPVSVLVVLHDGNGNILLIERADRAGFWQSVTGSIEAGETLAQTARREVQEETGITLSDGQLHDWQQSRQYEIYPHWRHRYPPGITRNTEHVFSARIAPDTSIKLSKEHTAFCWLERTDAAEKVFSPSNRQAILELAEHL